MMTMKQSHRDDFGLVGSELLHPQRLYWSELSVDFDLRKLAYGKVKVADLFRDQQHPFDDRRQIEKGHSRAETRVFQKIWNSAEGQVVTEGSGSLPRQRQFWRITHVKRKLNFFKQLIRLV